MLNWLDKQGELEEWTTRVIRRVEEAFPFPLHDNRGEMIGYLPHTQHVLERETTAEDEETRLLSKVGWSFIILDQYREAETLLRRALERREKVLGPGHLARLPMLATWVASLIVEDSTKRQKRCIDGHLTEERRC